MFLFSFLFRSVCLFSFFLAFPFFMISSIWSRLVVSFSLVHLFCFVLWSLPLGVDRWCHCLLVFCLDLRRFESRRGFSLSLVYVLCPFCRFVVRFLRVSSPVSSSPLCHGFQYFAIFRDFLWLVLWAARWVRTPVHMRDVTEKQKHTHAYTLRATIPCLEGDQNRNRTFTLEFTNEGNEGRNRKKRKLPSSLNAHVHRFNYHRGHYHIISGSHSGNIIMALATGNKGMAWKWKNKRAFPGPFPFPALLCPGINALK